LKMSEHNYIAENLWHGSDKKYKLMFTLNFSTCSFSI